MTYCNSHIFRALLAVGALLASLAGWAAQVSFSLPASQHQPVTVAADASTGLNDIFVLYSTAGGRAIYNAANANAKWMKYSNLGGGYAQEVPVTRDGSAISIALEADDMGYIIEDGDRRYYFWVVNYANHMPSLQALTFAEEQDCDRARLQLQGNAARITYYTINGQGRQLDRELTLTYRTQEYDETSEVYVDVEAQTSLQSIDGTFGVEAPYCDTDFTLTADRFLRAWDLEMSVTSDTYTAFAVDAHAWATQTERDNDNEQDAGSNGLGGSGPVEVTFKAAVTDAAIFREWEMSRDPNFEVIDDRYQQLEFTYNFEDNGNNYVRFVADNAQGSCAYTSETFEIFVAESDLKCPNAFSPGPSEGVNDEWKVSYKSLVSFECHIFNRWGVKMATLTDPSQGWDGKYKGKLVPAGTYYYVIKAKGSDGKNFDKAGDINIVGSRKSAYAGEQTESE